MFPSSNDSYKLHSGSISLNLSAESTSHSAVFFSRNKSATNTLVSDKWTGSVEFDLFTIFFKKIKTV